MADIYKSTGQITTPPNVEENVLAKGSIEVNLSADTVGYHGAASIDISWINSLRIFPEIEISLRGELGGGGAVYYQKLPFTSINSNGVASASGWFYVAQGNDKDYGTVTNISVFYYSLASIPSVTLYYKVLAREAGPYELDGWDT